MIELRWNNPISEASLARYIQALDLRPRQSVFDIGCGCGEVLIRIVRHYEAIGLGIDNSAEHIAEAIRRAEGRGCHTQTTFVVADASTFPVTPATFDLGICLGATHAFGLGERAYANAIQRMSLMLADGGLLLIGEGYLRQPAPPEYRQLLGAVPPDSSTHAANVELGCEYGLTCIDAWTSSEDEWDEFEWTYQRVVERQCQRRSNDLVMQARLDRRRTWMDAYRRWGRDTLGYGIYLFRKPIKVAISLSKMRPFEMSWKQHSV